VTKETEATGVLPKRYGPRLCEPQQAPFRKTRRFFRVNLGSPTPLRVADPRSGIAGKRL
jgi:hypothetical protein